VGENEFIELTFFSGKTNTQATAVPIVLRQYTASLEFYFPQTPYWGKPTNSLQVCTVFYKRIRVDDMSSMLKNNVRGMTVQKKSSK
jgi:hypothetical protein